MAGCNSIRFSAMLSDHQVAELISTSDRLAHAREFALVTCARDFAAVAALAAEPDLFAETWRAVRDFRLHAAELAGLAAMAEDRLRLVAVSRHRGVLFSISRCSA